MNIELEKEKRELSRIVQEGFDFTIEANVRRWVPFGPWGLFRKRKVVKQKYDFHIQEPTLGMLDRMSKEWIELAIEDEGMKNLDEMSKARHWVAKDARRCARIVAIAVMGSKDFQRPHYDNDNVTRETSRPSRCQPTPKTLDELTELFMNTIRPSQLYQLMVYISLTSNLGDFLNSIRLMCASRTTMPARIEDTEEG